MTTIAFLGISAGAVAFLVHVLVQFRRDQNRRWPPQSTSASSSGAQDKIRLSPRGSANRAKLSSETHVPYVH